MDTWTPMIWAQILLTDKPRSTVPRDIEQQRVELEQKLREALSVFDGVEMRVYLVSELSRAA